MKKKLNILVIAYYWPPDTGGGVQRILKVCKYLKAAGHDPVVVTKKLSAHAGGDRSFYQDTWGIRTIRVPFRYDPLALFGRHTPAASPGTPSTGGRFRHAVREYLKYFIWLNLFIPDAKIGWYRPTLKRLAALLKTEPFDAVLSSGPPYTVHLLGAAVKRMSGLPWLLDVRDPWLENPPYNRTYRFGLVRALNAFMERRVLRAADEIVTVGENLAELLSQKVRNKNIHVVYNGYDRNDLTIGRPRPLAYFRLGYYGMMDQHRLPLHFLRGVARELQDNPDLSHFFKLEVYGDVSADVRTALHATLPSRNLRVHPHVPHASLKEEYRNGQALLLLINNYKHSRHIITGKLFEYLYSGWPILGIGPPDGEAARIMEKTNTGKMFPHGDHEDSIQWLLELFGKWRAGRLVNRPVRDQKFDRSNQAESFEALIHSLISAH